MFFLKQDFYFLGEEKIGQNREEIVLKQRETGLERDDSA